VAGNEHYTKATRLQRMCRPPGMAPCSDGASTVCR